MKNVKMCLMAVASLCALILMSGCGGGGGNELLTYNPTDGAELCYIAPGTFIMGTPAGTGIPTIEQPIHQVTLGAYYIYKYLVTVGEYQAFCEATDRSMPPLPVGYTPEWSNWSGHENYPMMQVSWQDAKDYAEWANATLPTEAQWEYAARGPDGRNYPWGGLATSGDVDNGWNANMCANSLSVPLTSTVPVGSYPAGISWSGALDMAGNVWEWCADWYGTYPSIAQTDPTGPGSGTYRIVRGGSWYFLDATIFRGAFRGDFSPTLVCHYVGFRCVIPVP